MNSEFKNTNDLKSKLPEQLFWDIEFNKLDVRKNKRLIIDRVLSLGNIDQFKAIFSAYPVETITEELKQIAYLDPKTFEFVISFFNISCEEMKCYIKRQSHQQYWS